MTPRLSIIVPVYNQPELIVRALDSIPRRDDIEVIIIDDGSTDDTFAVCTKYAADHTDLYIRLISYPDNRGLGHAKNVGYDNCRGEYIHQLDSDDYLYTDVYNSVVDLLGNSRHEDIICINLVTNNGYVMRVNEANKHGYCGGGCHFYKRLFLGKSRCPEVRAAEDYALNEELLAKPHTEYFTDMNAYHYNFPREGSLYDLLKRGLL